MTRRALKVFLTLILVSPMALASVDLPINPEVNSKKTDELSPFKFLKLSPPGSVSPREIYDRTQSVLRFLGVAPEPSYQSDIQALNGLQSDEGIKKLLPVLDPEGQFQRFSTEEIQGSSPALLGFQDFDSKQVNDFSVTLASQTPTGISLLPLPAATNKEKPLAGVRVALDPGHMGGDLWDERTGKYVIDHHGHKISEGVINLQTALLLKADLENLGAQVLVTHETMAPVTPLEWDELDMNQYAAQELLAETLNPWFLELVQSQPAGPALNEAFQNSPDFKQLYKEEMRQRYYVLEADLDARSQMIQKFNPHLTLIIHYDAGGDPQDPQGVSPVRRDATKAYVAGADQPEEFATRQARAKFVEHLLDPSAFQSSRQFAHDILKALEGDLKLPPDGGNAGEAVTIEPGLMGRNLNLTRDLTHLTVAYVECLFYNDPVEFQAFLAPDHEMDIGGVKTTYSNRLVQVVGALEKGLMAYVQEARQNSISLP